MSGNYYFVKNFNNIEHSINDLRIITYIQVLRIPLSIGYDKVIFFRLEVSYICCQLQTHPVLRLHINTLK